MKLDRSKKYEGLGLTWEWADILLLWHGSEDGMGKADVLESVFEEWIDAGHIKPVRETKIVRVPARVSFNPVRWNDFRTMVVAVDLQLPLESLLPDGATSRQVLLEFEVEA